MKREVAELSGNFRRELSPQDGGEGIRCCFVCVWKQETHGGVLRAERGTEKPHTPWKQQILPKELHGGEGTPCARIAKTVQKI